MPLIIYEGIATHLCFDSMFPLLKREGLMIPYFCVTLLWNCMIGLSTSLNRHVNMVSMDLREGMKLMVLLILGCLCNIDRLAFHGSIYHSTRTTTRSIRRFERYHQLWILCIAVDVLFIPAVCSRTTCFWSNFGEKEIRVMDPAFLAWFYKHWRQGIVLYLDFVIVRHLSIIHSIRHFMLVWSLWFQCWYHDPHWLSGAIRSIFFFYFYGVSSF